MENTIKTFLEKNNITYTHHTHPATHTVKESTEFCKDIPGLGVKNLFLSDGTHHYLVILPGEKKLDIRSLEKTLHVKKLTFASEKDLETYLHTQPGHVSPLALLYDTQHAVQTIIDEIAWNAEHINFHPGINTETIVVEQHAFHTLIKLLTKNYLTLPL